MAALTETQKDILLAIAAGNPWKGRVNTLRSLRVRGLLAGQGLSPAGLAVFDGQAFRVTYVAMLNGYGRDSKRVVRNWTSGVTLAEAIAEVADLRGLGTGDPDCVKSFAIEIQS